MPSTGTPANFSNPRTSDTGPLSWSVHQATPQPPTPQEQVLLAAFRHLDDVARAEIVRFALDVAEDAIKRARPQLCLVQGRRAGKGSL